MDLPLEHLRTFAAVVDEGSLEGAARLLHVSPSAVSQRIRSMEERTGSVLLTRSRPVAVTATGATVLRAARQIARIIDDASSELGQGSTQGALVRLVINADSLATWFVPALARAATATGARFEVLRADETVSTVKLRSGEAMAALTATEEAVPGCVSTRVGVDRYHAVASPAFVRAHLPDGPTPGALAAAPRIDFDRHDMFQDRFLREYAGAPLPPSNPPRHFIPSSAEFVTAIELGMGWGMVPAVQCATPLAGGTLVEITPGNSLALPLYWQRWNLHSPVLDTLSEIIAAAASDALDFS
ncbi:LysR family transcriptional regulator ArgP [Leucobacter sp. BZR 635]